MEEFLNYGFEALTTFIESLIVVRFVLAFQDYDFQGRLDFLKYLCCSLTYAALVLVINYILPFEGLLGIIYVLFFIIVSIALTDSKLHIKILTSGIAVLILLLGSTFSTNLFSTLFRVSLENIYSGLSIMRILTVVTSLLIKFFIFDIILKTLRSNEIRLGKKEFGLILSVFGISFAVIALIQTVAASCGTGIDVILLFTAEILSTAVIIVCSYMTIALNKAQRNSEKLRNLAKQKEYSQQYAQNIKKQYNEIRRIRHDMKQTNSVVMKFLSEHKIDEAMKCLQKTSCEISDLNPVVDIENDFVNAILNTKLAEAKRHKIGILCSVDKGISDVDDIDLCNLLGNMLDNAIEACDKQIYSERFIEIRIQTFPNQLLIGVANTVDNDVIKENSELLTTKEDAENHGFGIESIRAIVKKYNGTVQFSQENRLFHCDAVLTKQNKS